MLELAVKQPTIYAKSAIAIDADSRPDFVSEEC